MSKYHKGDKFIVEIKEVMNSDNGTLYRSDFKTLTFDDNGLDKLKKVEPSANITVEDEIYIKALNDGRNEVWELIKKISLNISEGGFSISKLEKIFGYTSLQGIICGFTPQEALAKLEAYEKAKEIKVGNVVEATDFCGDVFKGTVLDFKDGAETEVFVLDENGCVDVWKIADCKKTGKHIEINNILEQIRGD